MATDLSRPLKAAIIDHLASSPVVTALVPMSRIYAMTPPATPRWPFIRYGSPITSGYDATCWDGSATRVTLHAFAETTTTYAGEDRALDIAAAIVEAMKEFGPDNLGIVENQYVQTTCIKDDDEADKWHSIVEFNLTVVEPV
ncbi:DUF3168 domain-containing protein [Pelagibacterium sp. H642]|uniref:DUF3168 domain-containing protein n=1 Tax=Pelagibacterium sp. H642 TaxID=1881069 RepID=UPI002814E1EF|nr:DUF3168 domain-containing protein [Pelagibacterium sp. H642]WMT90154.1 DUF3168 domain-containing protein [Pelagibacterium sp. H642]